MKKRRKSAKRKKQHNQDGDRLFDDEPIYPQRFTPVVGGRHNFTIMAHEKVRFAWVDFIGNGSRCFDLTLKCTGTKQTILEAIEWAYENRHALAELGITPNEILRQRRDGGEPLVQPRKKKKKKGLHR